MFGWADFLYRINASSTRQQWRPENACPWTLEIHQALQHLTGAVGRHPLEVYGSSSRASGGLPAALPEISPLGTRP